MSTDYHALARCHRCGEPCVPVLLGTLAEIEASPLIQIWCHGCAVTTEAEAITKESSDDQ